MIKRIFSMLAIMVAFGAVMAAPKSADAATNTEHSYGSWYYNHNNNSWNNGWNRDWRDHRWDNNINYRIIDNLIQSITVRFYDSDRARVTIEYRNGRDETFTLNNVNDRPEVIREISRRTGLSNLLIRDNISFSNDNNWRNDWRDRWNRDRHDRWDDDRWNNNWQWRQ